MQGVLSNKKEEYNFELINIKYIN